jgi:hypothetical protein
MDIVFHFFAVLLGIFLLVVIASPKLFVPEIAYKKKRVGASYWGDYQGQTTEESEDEPTIEVKMIKTKEKSVVGHTTYALGRGISFRGQ